MDKCFLKFVRVMEVEKGKAFLAGKKSINVESESSFRIVPRVFTPDKDLARAVVVHHLPNTSEITHKKISSDEL